MFIYDRLIKSWIIEEFQNFTTKQTKAKNKQTNKQKPNKQTKQNKTKTNTKIKKKKKT